MISQTSRGKINQKCSSLEYVTEILAHGCQKTHYMKAIFSPDIFFFDGYFLSGNWSGLRAGRSWSGPRLVEDDQRGGGRGGTESRAFHILFFNYQYDRILRPGPQLFGKQSEETSLYNPHLLVLGQGHGQALEDDLLSRKNRS